MSPLSGRQSRKPAPAGPAAKSIVKPAGKTSGKTSGKTPAEISGKTPGKILGKTSAKAEETDALCMACGTCCRKGGPTLHQQDLTLISAGVLPCRALLSLRIGELVHNEIQGGLVPLPAECIKVAGQGASWICTFWQADTSACSIYAQRPAQCRALFCRDNTALLALHAQPRLSRAEVLPLFSPNWSMLAEAHEERCAWHRLAPLALGPLDSAASQALLEAVRFDLAFRELAQERAGVPAEALPLLFGRPLRDLLPDFGLAVEHVAGEPAGLVRSGLCHYNI